MVLPLVKLGALAMKTVSKPIASRLKKEAGRHPQFRSFIISMAQVLLPISLCSSPIISHCCKARNSETTDVTKACIRYRSFNKIL